MGFNIFGFEGLRVPGLGVKGLSRVHGLSISKT